MNLFGTLLRVNIRYSRSPIASNSSNVSIAYNIQLKRTIHQKNIQLYSIEES